METKTLTPKARINEPQKGDYIYIDSETLRKIRWMGNTTFEWAEGWDFVKQIIPNPDYPKKSTTKWKRRY